VGQAIRDALKVNFGVRVSQVYAGHGTHIHKDLDPSLLPRLVAKVLYSPARNGWLRVPSGIEVAPTFFSRMYEQIIRSHVH